MWTVSSFLLERLWILVCRSPNAHGNNVTTCAEQFVFYLQVHLRLCSSHLNHSLFISSSADLWGNASKLTLSHVFFILLGGGGGSHLYSSIQKSISILTDFEKHAWHLCLMCLFLIRLVKAFSLCSCETKREIHTHSNHCVLTTIIKWGQWESNASAETEKYI